MAASPINQEGGVTMGSGELIGSRECVINECLANLSSPNFSELRGKLNNEY